MNIVFVNLLPFVLFSLFDGYVMPQILGGHVGIASPMLLFFMSLVSVLPLVYYVGMGVACVSAQVRHAPARMAKAGVTLTCCTVPCAVGVRAVAAVLLRHRRRRQRHVRLDRRDPPVHHGHPRQQGCARGAGAPLVMWGRARLTSFRSECRLRRPSVRRRARGRLHHRVAVRHAHVPARPGHDLWRRQDQGATLQRPGPGYRAQHRVRALTRPRADRRDFQWTARGSTRRRVEHAALDLGHPAVHAHRLLPRLWAGTAPSHTTVSTLSPRVVDVCLAVVSRAPSSRSTRSSA